MSRAFTLALVAIVAGVTLADAATARPRDYYDRGYRHDGYWAREYDNRRDARRAGIAAGAVRAGIAEAATEERYRDCMESYGYNYDCEAQRYRDEAHARRAGRRTAVIVGSAVRY